MGLAHESGKNIGKVIEPIRAGDDKIAARKLSVAEDTRTINVTSAAFTDGGSLPVTFTADGAGVAPPIAWTNTPDGARSVVFIVEDPDAPFPKPFAHWLVYSLPVTANSIASSPAGGREGKNSISRTATARAPDAARCSMRCAITSSHGERSSRPTSAASHGSRAQRPPSERYVRLIG
jgi:phosphatidylethanolamine-binding protein (PEBP) family uncharacterized protein